MSGDLGIWIGKSLAGKWKLNVTDTGFLNNGVDGQLNAWSITIRTVSSQKVAANAGFQFKSYAKHPVVCNASQLGFTYISTTDKSLYICNGTDFYPLALAVVGSQNSPGLSCKDILAKVPGSKDGAYWLNPTGSGAFQTWCDMTTDGGGWTLLAKVDGAKNTFAFDAGLWTDTNLLNADKVAMDTAEAKYASFFTLPFTQMRVGMAVGPTTKYVVINQKADSLRALMQGAYVATGVGRNAWKSLIGGSSLQANCNLEGFNPDCGGRKVRIGIVTNQEGDCNSCDSYLGFGHTGQGGCGGVGAGYTGNMASCTADNGDLNINSVGYLFAR